MTWRVPVPEPTFLSVNVVVESVLDAVVSVAVDVTETKKFSVEPAPPTEARVSVPVVLPVTCRPPDVSNESKLTTRAADADGDATPTMVSTASAARVRRALTRIREAKSLIA